MKLKIKLAKEPEVLSIAVDHLILQFKNENDSALVRRRVIVCCRSAPSHGIMGIEFYAWSPSNPEDYCLVEVARATARILAINSDYGNSGRGEAATGH